MTIKVRSASGVKGVNSVRVRGATSTIRAARIKVRTGLGVGDLDQVYTGVEAMGVAPASVYYDFSAFESSTVSGSIGVSITGGLAPFTYSWSVVSFSGSSPPSISSSTAASTNVTQTGLGINEMVTATFQCVVNDSTGQTDSVQFEAYFTNFNFA